MKRLFQVLANSLPTELIGNLEPSVYVLELQLRDVAVEYGDASLPSAEIQNRFETMKKRAFDCAIRLYDGSLISKYFTDGGIEDITSLEGQCMGVMILSKPKIKPETRFLANFRIRNDTLHYGERAISGHNQTPKGSVNVEFIGYSPKESFGQPPAAD